MKREEAKEIAKNYVDFYLREWSSLPHQSQLDADGQKQLLEKRDQIERDSQLPVGRVGMIVKDLVTLEKGSGLVEQVTDLIVRRSTPLGRVTDDANRAIMKAKRKLLKIN